MVRAGDDNLLTGARIRALLMEVGDELETRGESGELFVVGGAALALAYDAREATRDVDALFEPKATIYAVSEMIATRQGLRPGWLNDGMKGFLHGVDEDRTLAIEHPALEVWVASPRYLLAMKLLSARIERDADDIALLLRLCGIAKVTDALDLVEAAYGRDRVLVRTAPLLEAILVDKT